MKTSFKESKLLQQPVIGAFVLGFTAITFQIVLLREFLVSFYGTELSTGVVLGFWFFWTGFGAWFARLLPQTKVKQMIVLGHFLFVLLVPTTLLLLVLLRSYWGIAGQIVGLVPIIITALLSEVVFCFLSGFLFTLYCLTDNMKRKSPRSIGWIYLFDSIGAMTGGFVFSFIIVHLFGSWEVCILLSGLNILICIFFNHIFGKCIRITITTTILLIICLALFGGIDRGNDFIRHQRWGPTQILTDRSTKYGNIVATKDQEQISIYENSLLLVSAPDIIAMEERVHLALLQHPSPHNVLMIGGAVGGELSELIKHHPRSIDYIELDPALIDTATEFIPGTADQIKNDNRIHVHLKDGRHFIAKTEKTYDIILLNLPTPCNAQINRFYTQEFFIAVHKILKPDGILSFSVSSAENYIDPMLARYLRVIKETLKAVFTSVIIFPGEKNRFFASDEAQLTDDTSLLLDRLEQRQIETLFINRYYLPVLLSDERISYLKQTLSNVPEKQIWLNTDFRPMSYFFDMVLWSSQFSSKYKFIFSCIEGIPLSFYIILLILVLLISVILYHNKRESLTWYIGIPVAIMGFSEMAIEIIIILAFQVLYGYAYYKLGILVTCFMLGLTLGSGWIIAIKPSLMNKLMTKFILIQMMMVVFPVIVLGMMFLFSSSPQGVIRLISIVLVFPFMAIGGGIIGGSHFPLAAEIFDKKHGNVQSTAGWLYWFDLLGSSCGALITGTFLIPLLGIPTTLILVTIMNCVAVAMVTLYRRLLNKLVSNLK